MFENRNYGFIPKTSAPEGVEERAYALEGLYHYCNSDRDEECKGKADEMFGETVPLTEDALLRNEALGRAVAAHNGFAGKPDAYMMAAGMERPYAYDRRKLYEHIGERFYNRMRGAWDEQQAEKTRKVAEYAAMEKRLREVMDIPLATESVKDMFAVGLVPRAAQTLPAAESEVERRLRTVMGAAEPPQVPLAASADGGSMDAPVERRMRVRWSPREIATLKEMGVEPEEVELAREALDGIVRASSSEAYTVYTFERDTNKAFEILKGHEQAQELFFDALQRKTQGYFARGSMSGNAFSDFFLGVARSALGSLDAALPNAGVDESRELREFRGKVKGVFDAAREAGQEQAGFSFSKYTGKLGGLTGDLMPWMVGGWGGAALKAGAVMGVKGDLADRAAAAAPSATDGELAWKTWAYTGGYTASMLVGAGAAKAGVLALPGARALAAKVAPRAAGFMSKGIGESVVAGVSRYAYAAGVATVDMSLIRPAVAWTVEQGAFDLWSDNEELATATQEFAAALSGIASEDSVMASLIFGAMGERHVRARARLALEGREGALLLGMGDEVANRVMTIAPEKREEFLGKEFVRQWKEDSPGVMKRAVDELQRRKRVVVEGARREEEVVKASMRHLFGVDYEPSEKEGVYKVYSGGDVNEKGEWVRGSKVEEMSAEDLEVYIQYVQGEAVSGMNYLFKEAVGKKRLLDAFGKLHGSVEVKWLEKAVTERDMQRLRPLAEGRLAQRRAELIKEGKTSDEAERMARGEVHADLHKSLPLGDLLAVARAFPARGNLERAREGAVSGQVDTGAKVSHAFVLTRESVGAERGRRILYIANGATAKEIAEEVGEQVYQDFARENRLSPIGVYQHLRELQQAVAGSGAEGADKAARAMISLPEELDRRLMSMDAGDVNALSREELHAVDAANTEAVSFLMFHDLAQRVAMRDTELPGWAHTLFARANSEKMRLYHDTALAAALAHLRAKAPDAGGMSDAVRALLGVAPEAVEKALRGRSEPTMEEYMDTFREQLNRQNELDIAFGKGRLRDPAETEDFARHADEGQAEAQKEWEEREKQEAENARKVIEEAETDPENEGKSHDEVVRDVAERRADARRDEVRRAPEAVQDEAFDGGVCMELADEGGLLCRGGYVAVGKLAIMPNFKLGADEKTGVAHPLKGDYRPDHDPIRVWRRADGSLMVISGRHRLDACRRAGVGRIMCYVYDESPGRDEAWARRYDIESNIRDNQASVAEVALYVRGEFTDGRVLTDEQVERAGIAREGKAGSKGLRIGRRGTDAVLDALRNGRITEDEALAVSDFCPGNEPVQRAGLGMILAGESKSAALARMEGEFALQRAQAELGESGGYDLFGNALGNDAFMDFAAKYVVRRRNELARDASYLTTNVKRRNAAEMAKKYGVDIKDAEGMKRKLAQINLLRERWKNPYSDPELMNEMKAAYCSGLELEGAAGATIPESAGLRILEAAYGMRSGEETVHFSAAGVDTLKAVQERWNRTLDDYCSGKLNGWRRPLLFGQTPAVLQMLGAPALKMTITRDVLDKVTRDKHHLDIDELRKLPDSMHEPLAVFRSNTQGDSMVVLTELHEEGKPAIVAVHLDREQVNVRVNKIASVYGKSGVMSLFQGEALYADMTKIGKWTAMEGLQLPKIVEPISRGHRVLNPGDVVKWKNENDLPQVHFSVDNDSYKNDVGKSREYPKGSVIFISGRDVDLSRCHAVGAEGKKLDKDTFLLTPAGNLNWYEFPTDEHTQSMLKKKGIVPKPVRLRVGWQNERTGGGFGLLHVLKHYNAFLDMIPPESPLLHLFRAITGKLNLKSESASRKQILSENNGKTRKLVVELVDDGEYYSVVTCYPTGRPVTGESNGIVIKGTYLQFVSGRKTPSLNTGNQSNESTPESVSVTGRFRAPRVARQGGSVNIHDTKIVDNDGNLVFHQQREPEVDRVHFSIAGKKAKGYAAALDRGETYVDKADGCEKFVISTKGARLSSGFTMGMLNCPVGGHKDVSLPALLHFPELYRNYPELANIRVRVYTPKADEPFLGFATLKNPLTGEAPYIGVNMANMRRFPNMEARLVETLLHESQHMIQHVEGHARGGSVESREGAIALLNEAINKRKQKGVEDDWSRDNLTWLEELKHRVETVKDELAMKMLLFEVYRSLHGEQEARWTGARADAGGARPMDAMEGLTGRAPGHETIYLDSPPEFSELGGVTYARLGRWGYLLEERAPKGDFGYDRRLYQMMEAVRRRSRELRSHGSKDDGLKLAAEGLAMIDQINSLLPNQYKMALEPYKLYFNFYASLHASGSPERAAGIIPMGGWDVKMAGAMRRMAIELMDGEARASDMKYWMAHPELMQEVAKASKAAHESWERAKQEAHAQFADVIAQHNGRITRHIQKQIREVAEAKFAEEGGEEFFDLAFRALGEIRADKLMDKFLQRVTLLMDNYRKDVTLGRIRRAVDKLTPPPGKGGKPVKGRMGAADYNRVMDLVRLLELTPGQMEKFRRTRYLGDETPTGQKKESAWAEMDPDALVRVETYDENGKLLTVDCTKQEFETYAGFEEMSAERAEGAARALGEFISTGRQAWDNAQEARRARIAELCAPLLEKYDNSDNTVRAERARFARSSFPIVRRALNWAAGFMNDAQFFEALADVKPIAEWARMAGDTIVDAKRYMQITERDRVAFLRRVWEEASKTKGDERKMNEWFNAANETRDSGVKLVEQEPDFLGQEQAELRGQFLGMLHRKTQQKNFNPNKFAAALRAFGAKGSTMPREVMKEAMDKFGDIGDAGKSMLQGEDAVRSLLTPTEWNRLGDLEKRAQTRAAEARKKWLQERAEKGKPAIQAPSDNLQITRLEAAYRVLMTEQADYAKMLRRQGYTPEVVEKLRQFAGEDVMELAYKLREKLNERTEQVAELYERVYGMPFPRVENYFRAFFDVGYEVQGHTALDNMGGAAAGGGTAKIFYTRQQHNRKIDPIMNVFSAFEMGMREQDLLLAYGDMPDVLTAIINHKSGGKEMNSALEELLGVDAKGQLVEHVKEMKQLAAAVEVEGRAILRATRALSGNVAGTILNGRMSSLMKQMTAVFNSVAGSDAVSYGEWWASRFRCWFGMGKLSHAQMAEREELKSRFRGWKESTVGDAVLSPPDVKAGAHTHWANKAGLALMEKLDVDMNVSSAMTLYDAVYRKMQKQHPEWSREDLDEVAMHEVRKSLALKSQPLDRRSRAAMAAKQSVFKIGNLFLGGESFNTFGWMAELVARGKYGRAAQVWLTHGVALQALTLFYNWLTDDKEQWKRRSIAQYGIGALLGPIMGVPFASQAVGVAALALPRGWRPFLPSQSLVPTGDLERAANDCYKAFSGKKKSSWQDKCIAVDNCLRALLAVVLLRGQRPTTIKGAAAAGAAWGASGVLNLLDFLLRTERAAEERG